VVHKGIQLAIRELEPGIRRWEYTIHARIKSGTIRATSLARARRRVYLKIDFDLRAEYVAQRKRQDRGCAEITPAWPRW
jgi:hypothetical protein